MCAPSARMERGLACERCASLLDCPGLSGPRHVKLWSRCLSDVCPPGPTQAGRTCELNGQTKHRLGAPSYCPPCDTPRRPTIILLPLARAILVIGLMANACHCLPPVRLPPAVSNQTPSQTKHLPIGRPTMASNLTNNLRSLTGIPISERSGSSATFAEQHALSASPANNNNGELGELGESRAAGHWSLPNRPSLFSIIRFPNEECFDSSNQSGTCYTAFECKLLGGQPSSPCAAGFGSCCIVSRTCHVTTREKVIYFKNPSYPSADSDEKFCDLTVEMGDINVCQLRLDFLDFQLDPPTNGACKDDYMEISASGMPPQSVPRLCGMNRNQHLYINLPQDLSERSASIVFYTDPVGDHRWQVKVTQIDCNQYRPLDWKRQYAKFASSPLWNAHPVNNGGLRLPIVGGGGGGGGKYSTTFASGFQTMSQTASALAYEFLKPQFTPRAPMGCLQYFTSISGIIESFNFGQYLNNLDYSICIQRQPDTCRLVFTSSDFDWSLNGVGIAGSSSGVGDQDCARDYLLIPGASRTGDGFTYDRYCGGRLNYYRGQSLSAPVVMKTSGPIVLRFHSDAHFESVNNGGFRLQYDQSTQDCIYHTAEEAGSLASQQLMATSLSDSRPYVSPLMSDSATSVGLYASQQLSTNHVNDFGQQQQQQQQQVATPQQYLDMASAGHAEYANRPVGQHQHDNLNLDMMIKPLISLNNKTFSVDHVNQMTSLGNQLKRRQDSDDDDDHHDNESQFGDQLRLFHTRPQSRPATGNLLTLAHVTRAAAAATAAAPEAKISDRANQLLATDLSKAFQLITTRQDLLRPLGGRQARVGRVT